MKISSCHIDFPPRNLSGLPGILRVRHVLSRLILSLGLAGFSLDAAAEEWVADLPPAPLLFPKSASAAQVALPRDFAADRDLALALRAVDVFGNVSEVSNVIRGRMPASVGGQAQPDQEGLMAHHVPLTGKVDPVIPAPSGFMARLDPRTGLLQLTWTPPRDPEVVGYQLVRNADAAPLAPDASEIVDLAVWDFPPVTEDGPTPEAFFRPVRQHEALQPLEIRPGAGLRIMTTHHYNSSAIPIDTGADFQDAPDRHLAWTLSPRDGYSLALSSLRIGIWQHGGEGPPSLRLEYSFDGFETRGEIPLVLERPPNPHIRPGAGAPANADLGAVPALRDVRRPVEFRLYVWGVPGRGIGKLSSPENLHEDRPDIFLRGAVRP